MKRAVFCVLSVYASVPVLMFLFPWIISHLLFTHLWRTPFGVDLSRPESLLNHTRNFYLHPEEGVSVGVWHTLPAGQWEAGAGKSLQWYREALGDGSPVIIFLHGRMGTRAMSHRVAQVVRLSAAGYHVVTFDYRGFGDSTGEPSEAGLTADTLYLYEWVKAHSRGGLVCVWGQSLGSGVATNTALKLQERGSAPVALILQGAYTNMREAALQHRVAKMYLFLPGFQSFLISIMEKNQILFPNDENLKRLSGPLLLLHAEDDEVIPYHMGLKLHQISLHAHKQHNSDAPVEMVSFSAHLKYSHNRLFTDPDLMKVVGGFLQKVRKWSGSSDG